MVQAWTLEEDELIRKEYPHKSAYDVSKLLTGRTAASVKTRAVNLKVTKTLAYKMKLQKASARAWNRSHITVPNTTRHRQNANLDRSWIRSREDK